MEKIKVMDFNIPKREASKVILTYRGERVEVISSYVYLGVLFSGPHFSLTPIVEARLVKGYAALTTLKNQCFQL